MRASPSQTVEAETIEVVDQDQRQDFAWQELTRLSALLWGGCLLFLPVAFGGVHPAVYLSIEGLSFAVCLLFLFLSRSKITNAASKALPRPAFASVVYSLLALLIILVIQFVFHSFQQSPHPLFGSASPFGDFPHWLRGARETVYFLAVFTLTYWLLVTRKNSFVMLLRFLCLAGFLVSLIALSHWFYDNGKLFWRFEPQHVLKSSRARWPFVNPNHLGHFTLLVIFPVWYLVWKQAKKFRDTLLPTENKREDLIYRLTRSRVQWALIRVGVLSMVFIGLLISLLGSLSRGSWLGFCIAVGVLFLAGAFSPKSAQSQQQTAPSQTKRKRRRRRTHPARSAQVSNISLSRYWRFALPALLIVLVLALLNERGSELIEKRIEYGLLSSKENIRWQLYRDSSAILNDHLWVGIGLGNWSSFYRQHMHPQLSGLDPQYLHSEPYQLLIEVGLLGILPILFLVLRLGSLSIRTIRARGLVADSRKCTLHVLCGLVAFLIAALVDFPFRIPALSTYFCILLAALCFSLDRNTQQLEAA